MTETISYVLPPELAGATVRHVLRSRLHFSSHGVSRLAHAESGILVNGLPARTTQVLRPGDVLTVETGDHRPPRAAPLPGDWPLPVVWEDGHLLVVSKPAGMAVHASSYAPDTPTVAGALAHARGSGFIFHPVNRLDKGTTGLMVVAKSGYVHDLLRRALHTPAFRREYRAVCLGCPEPPEGTVDAPIGRDEPSPIRRRVRPDGAAAQTWYRVLAQSGGMALLGVVPRTGRTHQIRLHMAHLGCPLAGDWLYGTEDPALIPRPALHACALALTHPVTGEPIRLTAPLPPDMERLVPPPEGDHPSIF